MGSRFRNPSLAAERHAAIVVRNKRIRLDPERRLVLGDGFGAPADGAENIAEIVARAGTVRTQRDRALRMGERFRQAIGTLQQRGKMNVSIDKVGTQCDGTAIMLLGVRLAADQFEHRSQIEMCNRRSWRAFQDPLELRQCFIDAPKRPQSPSEIVTSFEIAGVKRHCPLEAGYCIRKQSVGRENYTSVVVRLGEIRIEQYGPANQGR